MVNKKWLSSEKTWLFLLVVLMAVARIIFLLKCENMGGPASNNVEKALFIIGDPDFRKNFDGNSSMLYNYAIAAFLYFWREPILAARAFTALFGIFLVIPYYGVIKVLFNRTVAFFSSLVLVFYPLHIVQSSAATSDAVYYFFIFGSFYYFFRYINDPKRILSLLLSVLSFNIASLLRFESWLYIPVFFFLLWPKGKRAAFAFLILSVACPCLHLMLNHLWGNGFLYSFTTPAKSAHAEIVIGRVSYDSRPWSWLAALWQNSGPSLVIGGLSGMALAFLTRQRRSMAIFFLLLLSAFTVNTLLARMWVNSYYTIIFGLFLIPYAWFFGDKALDLLGFRNKAWLILLLVFPALNFWHIAQEPYICMPGMLFVIPQEVKTLGLWLKDHARPDERVIIGADRYDAWENIIMFRSGISPSRFSVIHTPLTESGRFENREAFERHLLALWAKYLVLNSESYLQKVLNFQLDQKVQTLGGISFEVVFEQEVVKSGKYIIYRISY